MKCRTCVKGLVIVALMSLIVEAKGQGVLEQLKQFEGYELSPARNQQQMTPQEVCERLASETSDKCRVNYINDRYVLTWRGEGSGNHGGVFEVLTRGDAGALCFDIVEVRDFTRCFPLKRANSGSREQQ